MSAFSLGTNLKSVKPENVGLRFDDEEENVLEGVPYTYVTETNNGRGTPNTDPRSVEGSKNQLLKPIATGSSGSTLTRASQAAPFQTTQQILPVLGKFPDVNTTKKSWIARITSFLYSKLPVRVQRIVAYAKQNPSRLNMTNPSNLKYIESTDLYKAYGQAKDALSQNQKKDQVIATFKQKIKEAGGYLVDPTLAVRDFAVAEHLALYEALLSGERIPQKQIENQERLVTALAGQTLNVYGGKRRYRKTRKQKKFRKTRKHRQSRKRIE